MSISDWQSQDATTPLVAVSLPPQHESADVELGGRLAEDLASLTRVLLGPDVPDSLVARFLPPPVAEVAVAVEPESEPLDVVEEPVVLDDPVVAVQQLVMSEPVVTEADAFVAPPVVEIEPLYTEPEAEFVAPPVVEVEPLLPLTPAAPATTPRQLIDELSSLDL